MQKVLEDKLNIYQTFLESKGFDQINLDIILREKAKAITQFDIGGRIDLPDELKNYFTPMGNPPSFMAGFAVSEERGYAMIFKSQDTAVNLTLSAPKDKVVNPLLFMHILEEKLSDILIETRDGVNALGEKFVETPMEYKFENLGKIEQLETIIYHLLTNRPILIVGPIESGLNILSIFMKIIPEEYHWKFGFSINMPYFPHENITFAIMDNLPQFNLEVEVNSYLDNDHCLVDLYEFKAYGEFSCKYTKDIVWALQDKSIEKAQEIVDYVYGLAKDVEVGESAQQYGDRTQTLYENADLIVDIAKKIRRENK